MKLYLARHGETDMNLKKKFYGLADVGLDKRGIEQAHQLAQKLKAKPLSRIVVSGLRRSEQTAAEIQADHPQASLVVEPRLSELHFGHWEGLSADEIQAADPQTWQAWLDAPFEVAPTDGEAYPVFKKRVLAGFHHLMTEASETDAILLVVHLGTLRVINQVFYPEVDFWARHFPAGTYSMIDVSKEGQVRSVVYDQ